MPILYQNNIDSSVIKTIVYDTSKEVLAIQFQTKSVWAYLDVPLEVYYNLISSPSKGNYFNKHIRNSYEAVKRERFSPKEKVFANGEK